MDFNAAIQAHANWKLRLHGYSRGTLKETIDERTAGSDNLCALGQWIHGEGKTVMDKAGSEELRLAHAAFHKAAACIAAIIGRGEAPAAVALLDSPNSDFNRYSREVTKILMRLRDR